jgi:hypothetical protein
MDITKEMKFKNTQGEMKDEVEEKKEVASSPLPQQQEGSTPIIEDEYSLKDEDSDDNKDDFLEDSDDEMPIGNGIYSDLMILNKTYGSKLGNTGTTSVIDLTPIIPLAEAKNIVSIYNPEFRDKIKDSDEKFIKLEEDNKKNLKNLKKQHKKNKDVIIEVRLLDKLLHEKINGTTNKATIEVLSDLLKNDVDGYKRFTDNIYMELKELDYSVNKKRGKSIGGGSITKKKIQNECVLSQKIVITELNKKLAYFKRQDDFIKKYPDIIKLYNITLELIDIESKLLNMRDVKKQKLLIKRNILEKQRKKISNFFSLNYNKNINIHGNIINLLEKFRKCNKKFTEEKETIKKTEEEKKKIYKDLEDKLKKMKTQFKDETYKKKKILEKKEKEIQNLVALCQDAETGLEKIKKELKKVNIEILEKQILNTKKKISDNKDGVNKHKKKLEIIKKKEKIVDQLEEELKLKQDEYYKIRKMREELDIEFDFEKNEIITLMEKIKKTKLNPKKNLKDIIHTINTYVKTTLSKNVLKNKKETKKRQVMGNYLKKLELEMDKNMDERITLLKLISELQDNINSEILNGNLMINEKFKNQIKKIKNLIKKNEKRLNLLKKEEKIGNLIIEDMKNIETI